MELSTTCYGCSYRMSGYNTTHMQIEIADCSYHMEDCIFSLLWLYKEIPSQLCRHIFMVVSIFVAVYKVNVDSQSHKQLQINLVVIRISCHIVQVPAVIANASNHNHIAPNVETHKSPNFAGSHERIVQRPTNQMY